MRCPAELIRSWLPSGRHPNLLLRVAVREVEAWLLGDADRLAALLKIRVGLVPPDPEALGDPKAALIALAANSPAASIRSALVPGARSTAKQGPGHNEILSSFVESSWRPGIAALRCTSLARAMRSFVEFRPQLATGSPPGANPLS